MRRKSVRPSPSLSLIHILRLLHNEKYCGDLLQKKYRTVDHLTHRKVVNRGAEEQFRLENHHPAIVSRAQFAAVQAELARRAGLAGERSRFSARYWYSGKLVCGAVSYTHLSSPTTSCRSIPALRALRASGIPAP